MFGHCHSKPNQARRQTAAGILVLRDIAALSVDAVAELVISRLALLRWGLARCRISHHACRVVTCPPELRMNSTSDTLDLAVKRAEDALPWAVRQLSDMLGNTGEEQT